VKQATTNKSAMHAVDIAVQIDDHHPSSDSLTTHTSVRPTSLALDLTPQLSPLAIS
jgi:hypothetical protein